MDNQLIILLTDLEYTLGQIKYKKVDVKKINEQLTINDNIDNFINNYFDTCNYPEYDEPNISNIIYNLYTIGDDYTMEYYIELFEPLTNESKELFIERLETLIDKLKNKYKNVNG